jgi:hypothetical protein
VNENILTYILHSSDNSLFDSASMVKVYLHVSHKKLIDKNKSSYRTFDIHMSKIHHIGLTYIRPFNKGQAVSGTFTCLKWSLVPADFKECCIR